jgi:hypothetical protein
MIDGLIEDDRIIKTVWASKERERERREKRVSISDSAAGNGK